MTYYDVGCPLIFYIIRTTWSISTKSSNSTVITLKICVHKVIKLCAAVEIYIIVHYDVGCLLIFVHGILHCIVATS